MITEGLIRALGHAQHPRSVRALNWALEQSTGYRAADLMQRKDAVIGTVSTGSGMGGDWYARNGYKMLASMYGTSTYAGVSVSGDAALESSAVYAGVKVIAEDMGSLPFFTYRRSADHDRVEVAFDHPLYQTLKNLVNPDMSSGEFVEALTAHAILTGNGYAEIKRQSTTVTLWPWQPAEVTVDRNKSGSIYYIRKETNGAEKTYARKDVFHLRGFTFDGICGDPILVRARQIIGITLAAQEYAGRFFAQDATPGIVISRPFQPGQTPWSPATVELIKQAWKQWHQGLARAHEPAVLQDGAEATRVAPTHVESQLIEQRKFQVVEVCRILRLPPHKLADLDRSTFSNITHQAIEYIQTTLSPWVERWKRAVYRCLLTVDEQMADRIYAEHEVMALLRGDFASQAEGFRKLLEKGVYSINEVRRLINFNPIEGGDQHFIQLNLATVQDVASGATIGKDQTGQMPVNGVREEE